MTTADSDIYVLFSIKKLVFVYYNLQFTDNAPHIIADTFSFSKITNSK